MSETLFRFRCPARLEGGVPGSAARRALAPLVLLYGGFLLASELTLDGIGSVRWFGLAGTMAILTLLVFRFAPRSVVVVTDASLTIDAGTADAITLPFGEIADMTTIRGWVLIRTAWDLRIAFRPPRLVQEDVLDVLADRLARAPEAPAGDARACARSSGPLPDHLDRTGDP